MKPLQLLSVLCLTLAACALDRAPTGGPVDREPLEILSIDPPNASVNTSPERIVFSFNRYVPASSLRRSLSLSPSGTDFTLKGSGNEAELRFRKPLDENKTYTITINKSLRSSRGNELPRSYTYAFSTGPSINRGIISGRVFSHDARPQPNALILAYAVQNDSLPVNPFQREADYSIQTGFDGAFTLDYLAEGGYRLIALQDRNGDRRLNPENEPFGAGYRELVRTGMTGNFFRLSTPRQLPKLVYCDALNRNLVEISFDRPFPVKSFKIGALTVLDTAQSRAVPVKGFYSVSNTMESKKIRVVTGPLDKKRGYRITYNGDIASVICRGTDKERKENVSLTGLLPKNGEQTAFLRPSHPERGRTVDISFNVPVAPESLGQAVKLYRVNGDNSSPLAFSISPVDNRRYTLHANPAFRNGNTYRIDIRMANLVGINAERASDSLATSIFTVARSEDFGTITGSVSGGSGTVVVEALDPVNRWAHRTIVERSGASPADFTIDQLAPGKYTLRAYIPRSEMHEGGNTSWNPGKVYPFEPADLFSVHPDTVTVRKGWETENISLIFPTVMP